MDPIEDVSSVTERMNTLDKELALLQDELDEREDDIETSYEADLDELSRIFKAREDALLAKRDRALSHLYEEMREKMELLRDASVAARRQHNRLTALHKLPSELVCKIYANIHAIDPFRPRSWIVLCHVYSHWRSIALSCQPLWTSIQITDQTSPQWTDALFAQSGTTPVDLSLKLYGIFLSGFLKNHGGAVFTNFSRISTLQVYATPDLMNELLLQFDYAAPNLQSLELISLDSVSSVAVSIPPTLFRMRSPRLSQLGLSGPISISTEMCLPVTITHLSLFMDYSAQTERQNMHFLCDRLTSLPQLKVLSLKLNRMQCIMSPNSEHSYVLPQLEELAMKLYIGEASTLLAHLEAPNLRFLELSIECALAALSPPLAAFEELLEDVSSLLNIGPRQKVITSAEVAEKHGPVMHISAWTNPAARPLLSLLLYFAPEPTMLAAVPVLLHLSNVEAMILRCQAMLSSFTDDVWAVWLDQLSLLTTLNLASNRAGLFLHCLRTKPSLMPSLKRLLLQHVDFGHPRESNNAYNLNLPEGGLVQSPGNLLVEVLAMKQAIGARVQLLHLRHCANVTLEMEGRLRTVVDTLIIDPVDL